MRTWHRVGVVEDLLVVALLEIGSGGVHDGAEQGAVRGSLRLCATSLLGGNELALKRDQGHVA